MKIPKEFLLALVIIFIATFVMVGFSQEEKKESSIFKPSVMSDLINIVFLISGLILAIFIYYLIERIKEGRLRKNIAKILENEIAICGEDAKTDLESVGKIKEFPKDIQKERLYLGAFVISKSLYGTSVYASYIDRIYLFKRDAQKTILHFYNLIIKIRTDIDTIRPLAEKSIYPEQMVKDLYEIQTKLRNDVIETSSDCIKELKMEEKNRLVSGFIKPTKKFI